MLPAPPDGVQPLRRQDTAGAPGAKRVAIGSREAYFRTMPPESDDFVGQCLRTLGLRLGDVRIDGTGRRNLVVVHQDSDSVFRFPRVEADAESLPDAAVVHQTAAHFGLPVPALLGYQAGSAGTAHMQVQFLAGGGLDSPTVQGLAARQPVRIGRQLAALLLDLRSISPTRCPLPRVVWSEIWTDLARSVASIEHHVPSDFFDSVNTAVDRAHDASKSAQMGLVHGDLGGVNTRFDDPGRLTGVLDWDGSGVGDVAADVTAVAMGIPTAARKAMIATVPEFRNDIKRCETYVDTWAGQGALWAIEVGDEIALEDMIARERERSRAT